MNKVILIGSIVRNIEKRYTQSGTAITKFTLAVTRETKNKEGVYESDYISCIAYNKTAELICQYLEKGDLIAIQGRIQTGSYEKNGQKIYTTDVIVERIQFLNAKKKEKSNSEIVMEVATENPNLPF